MSTRKALRETRTAMREARLKQQAAEHEAMRRKLRGETDTATSMLAELRVAHLGAGHFVNGHFVNGVGAEAAALALKPDTIPPGAK